MRIQRSLRSPLPLPHERCRAWFLIAWKDELIEVITANLEVDE